MIGMNGASKQQEAQELTPRQAQALELLVGGSSIVATAKQLNLNESTIRRWQRLPHFATAYQAAKDDIFRQVLRGLQRQSLFVLDKHLRADVEVTPASQIRAIALVFEQSLAMEKVAEIEKKLDELGQLLEKGNYYS